MTVKTILLSTAVVGTLFAGSISAAEARCGFGCGAAVGVVGGLIVGSALAQPGPVYAEPGYVVVDEPPPPPRRVYRARVPQCDTYIKYDQDGRPFEWKDCH